MLTSWIFLLTWKAYANCGIPDQCKALGTAAGTALTTGMTSAANQQGNIPGQASGLASATGSCGTNFTNAASQCSALKSKCDTCSQSEQDSCRKQIDSMITTYTAQAGSCTKDSSSALKTQSTSNSGQDLSSLMTTALTAGALAYMMANNNKGSDSTSSSTSNAALTKSGLDCSKSDAWRYVDCDSTFVSSCAYTGSDSTSTTGYGSTICTQFVNRYCATSVTTGTSVSLDGSNYYTRDSTGAGLGSTFCQNQVAASYCTTSGRDLCPSCQQLQRSISEGCIADPSSCLAENSTDTLEAAKTTCPTDPMFSNPNFTTTTTSTTSSSSSTTVATTTLPQSIGNGTTDVVGTAYGPSLFNITQSVISSRCETGKLNCTK